MSSSISSLNTSVASLNTSVANLNSGKSNTNHTHKLFQSFVLGPNSSYTMAFKCYALIIAWYHSGNVRKPANLVPYSTIALGGTWECDINGGSAIIQKQTDYVVKNANASYYLQCLAFNASFV